VNVETQLVRADAHEVFKLGGGWLLVLIPAIAQQPPNAL
jgi:hypothetical protein